MLHLLTWAQRSQWQLFSLDRSWWCLSHQISIHQLFVCKESNLTRWFQGPALLHWLMADPSTPGTVRVFYFLIFLANSWLADIGLPSADLTGRYLGGSCAVHGAGGRSAWQVLHCTRKWNIIRSKNSVHNLKGQTRINMIYNDNQWSMVLC